MRHQDIRLALPLNRPQSAALLRAINRALGDPVTLPEGTDRKSLVVVKRALIEAREGCGHEPL